MWQIKKVSILLLFLIFFASCSGEEPLQNPQTGENVENQKIKVAVRIGFQDNLSWDHNELRDGVNRLYNIVTYNSIAIKLLELPDIEFVRDDSIDGIWDYMIEFGISSVDNDGNSAVYWIILQNADNSDSKSRIVFYPDISLARIYYYYESESIGNKVVEQKQYASEGTKNQKAKVAINIHENSAYKEGAYNSIAKNLVVLQDVEFKGDSTIDGVWDYMVEFGMLFPHNDGSRNIAYWTTLQNADSSNGESRTVFYPDINFKILDFADFAQLQNINRNIVEQFRSNYLDTR
ncbi:MAG: hypothetical protein OXI43_16965 [Candidatus Poribacteria bacterium]|nr:hypothetical protein [Candidatus Poribacteria bacterium]